MSEQTATQLKANRSVLKYVLLSIVTFGVYPIVFFAKIGVILNRIASRHDGRKTMHYCLVHFVFAPITFGIVGIVWHNRLANRIGRELQRRQIAYRFSGRDYWLWNVLGSFIFVGQFVYLHKLCKAMRLLSLNYNING